MPFVKISKNLKREMYKQGGYRERSCMDNASCYTSLKLENPKKPDSIKVVRKDGNSAVFSIKRNRWVN